MIAGAVTVYIGEVFEWDVTTGSMRRYHYVGAQRVASGIVGAKHPDEYLC